MRTILSQCETDHDRAIAKKWATMFDHLLLHIQDENKKFKILKTMASCTTEDQLLRYYYVVQKYVHTLWHFELFNFNSWLIYHVHCVMRWV